MLQQCTNAFYPFVRVSGIRNLPLTDDVVNDLQGYALVSLLMHPDAVVRNTYDDGPLPREALCLQEVREVALLVRVDEDEVEWLV